MASTKAKTAGTVDGTIHPAVLYSFKSLAARGFGAAVMRTLQRHGLRTHRVGRVKCVLGKNFIETVESLPADSLPQRAVPG
jgi:hypothetical protein